MSIVSFVLNEGWELFLAFLAFMFAALLASSYTTGGISHHPYHRRYGDAPGAGRSPRIAGHTPGERSVTDRRGTR